MMWSTFIVKRLSAATFLMEKVRCARTLRHTHNDSLMQTHTVSGLFCFLKSSLSLHRWEKLPKIVCVGG